MKFIGNTRESYFDNPVRNYPILIKLLMIVACLLVGLVTKILWRWTIQDKKRLLTEKGQRGQVIIMNHVSLLDPIPIIIYMTLHGRYVRPIYKSGFDDNFFFKWFFPRMGAIPVVRDTADIKALRLAQRALEAGDSVLIFPEGTRVKRDEDSQIHGGFALIAQMGKADIVPMAIVGGRSIMPYGSKMIHFNKVRLRVGEPLSFEQFSDLKRKERIRAMEELAVQKVFQMRNQMYEEYHIDE